jgi:predicted transposase/invertase (TIGR01784 family)
MTERTVYASGRKEGIEIGKEEGKIEEKLAIALKLVQRGTPIEDVSEITGLAVAQIKEAIKN